MHDWWIGYLFSECKIQLENAAMGVAVLLFVFRTSKQELFIAVIAFAISMVG